MLIVPLALVVFLTACPTDSGSSGSSGSSDSSSSTLTIKNCPNVSITAGVYVNQTAPTSFAELQSFCYGVEPIATSSFKQSPFELTWKNGVQPGKRLVLLTWGHTDGRYAMITFSSSGSATCNYNDFLDPYSLP